MKRLNKSETPVFILLLDQFFKLGNKVHIHVQEDTLADDAESQTKLLVEIPRKHLSYDIVLSCAGRSFQC